MAPPNLFTLRHHCNYTIQKISLVRILRVKIDSGNSYFDNLRVKNCIFPPDNSLCTLLIPHPTTNFETTNPEFSKIGYNFTIIFQTLENDFRLTFAQFLLSCETNDLKGMESNAKQFGVDDYKVPFIYYVIPFRGEGVHKEYIFAYFQ